VTGEFASAEDAAAEGFRQALAGLDALRDPNRFGPWLRTIVVRKARLGLRSRATTDALVEDLPDSNERPDSALERLELAVLIQRSVRQLPDGLREAVSIFYIEGYDSDAAARFLDIPAGTFRRRLHEGRKRLRSAAKQILQGSKSMNQEREREIEKVKSLIDNADGAPEPLFEAFRGALALRPAAPELIELIRRQMESANKPDGPEAPQAPEGMPGGKDFKERARLMAQRFGTPSGRASDPNHPVGSVAAAIRQALPQFQDWPLDLGEAAARFFSSTGEHRSRLRASCRRFRRRA
jgi:RNA polymerase sigma factor (sigma-70 family)